MLNVRHRQARLAYIRQHLLWGTWRWNNVLFTDESRFCLFGNDRCPQVWCRRGERRRQQNFVQPIAVFNGGSVMVGVGFHNGGVSH